MFEEKNYHRMGDVWISDRFVSGYDHDEGDYYLDDNYVEHRYFRGENNYYHTVTTLLNDRQGYINFILDTIDGYVEEYGEDCRLLVALREEISNYKELWE